MANDTTIPFDRCFIYEITLLIKIPTFHSKAILVFLARCESEEKLIE